MPKPILESVGLKRDCEREIKRDRERNDRVRDGDGRKGGDRDIDGDRNDRDGGDRGRDDRDGYLSLYISISYILYICVTYAYNIYTCIHIVRIWLDRQNIKLGGAGRCWSSWRRGVNMIKIHCKNFKKIIETLLKKYNVHQFSLIEKI